MLREETPMTQEQAQECVGEAAAACGAQAPQALQTQDYGEGGQGRVTDAAFRRICVTDTSITVTSGSVRLVIDRENWSMRYEQNGRL